MAGVLYFWDMSKALTLARNKVLTGKVTRVGQLITLRNAHLWEERMGKIPGFLERRVKDPQKWRLVDAHYFATLLDIEAEQAVALINAEVEFRESQQK